MVVPRLIDHTTLDTFERCEQEGVYRFRDHLDSGRPDAAKLFGLAVHAGIRQFYDAPHDTAAMLAAVTTAWGSAEFPAENWRTVDYARDVVAAYAAEYPASKWDFEVVMNERYLEDATECGIVDRVVRRKVDGLLYVLDLKTTGWWPSPGWQEQWRHSQQAARYIKLVENHFEDCVREDGQLRNPEGITGFWCDAIYVNRRGFAKKEDFVRVGPFPYSVALRAELAYQRGYKMGRLLNVFRGDDPAMKNTSHCFRWNQVCPFLRFCVAEPTDRKDLVALALANGELVEREWTPKTRE